MKAVYEDYTLLNSCIYLYGSIYTIKSLHAVLTWAFFLPRMCKQISGKYIRNMHGPYIDKKRNGKNQIIQYLLGLGAAVVLIGVWVVSATKMIKQTTESKVYN